jgi:hypothetical protein
MGIQQILTVVLGVIIVGIMILVGISIFNTHAYVSNKNALISELTTYPPFAAKFCKTSSQLGGALNSNGMIQGNLVTKESISGYIGFGGSNYSTSSENGESRLISVRVRDTASETQVTIIIRAMGNALRKGKHPQVTTTLTVIQNKVTTSASYKKVTDSVSLTTADAASW